jgi:hypothetical protein
MAATVSAATVSAATVSAATVSAATVPATAVTNQHESTVGVHDPMLLRRHKARSALGRICGTRKSHERQADRSRSHHYDRFKLHLILPSAVLTRLNYSTVKAYKKKDRSL